MLVLRFKLVTVIKEITVVCVFRYSHLYQALTVKRGELYDTIEYNLADEYFLVIHIPIKWSCIPIATQYIN